MGAGWFRVVDHFVDFWCVGMGAGHQPALGVPGWVVGRRFLGRRDDQRAAVGKHGVDDVVAEPVLDRALKAAAAEGTSEVPVTVLVVRGVPVEVVTGRYVASPCVVFDAERDERPLWVSGLATGSVAGGRRRRRSGRKIPTWF